MVEAITSEDFGGVEVITLREFLGGTVDVMHMVVPFEGQRYVCSEMDKESDEEKLVMCAALTLLYQAPIITTLFGVGYKLGPYLFG